MIDRKGAIARINARELLGQLEFGCGPMPGRPGHVTVDMLDLPNVDIVGDVMEVLDALEPGTIRRVYASHFIEHVDDLAGLLRRLARVCASDAEIEFVVPHFSNPYYYSDPTHRTPFGLYTFAYLARDRTGMRRTVPGYARNPDFELRSVHMGFKSWRPNYVRHALKRGLEKLVNLGNFTRELHEEIFVWLFPVYELTYRLTPARGDGG